MKSTVEIPFKNPQFEITLVYMEAYHGPGTEKSTLHFLHRARLRQIPERTRLDYMNRYAESLPKYTAAFAVLMADLEAPDVIVRAPSSRTDNEPYFSVAKAAFPAAEAFAAVFAKEDESRAGEASDFAAFLAGVSFTPPEHFPRHIGKLLIVDEIFSGGKTAAAMLARMAEAGTTAESTVVAVALYVGQPLREAGA